MDTDFTDNLIPFNVSYARILIDPTEDDTIEWYEILNYSTKIKIEVSKNQRAYEQKLIDDLELQASATSYLGEGTYNLKTGTLDSGSTGWHWYEPVNCIGKTKLIIKLDSRCLNSVQPIGHQHAGRAMFNIYDEGNKTDITKIMTYNVIYEDSNISYIEFD